MSASILLIEDDADLRQIWAEYLGSLGFLLFEAAIGQDGLALAEQHQPRLVVLDWSVPGLRAGALLQKLSAVAPGAALVVATGHGPGRTEEARNHPSVVAVLHKPFRLRELGELAKRQIRGPS